jgi:Chaperone of endosialidase
MASRHSGSRRRPQGPAGPQGEQGEQGEQGPQGERGPEGSIESEPQDGVTYGRRDGDWASVLPTIGGTISGSLQINGQLVITNPDNEITVDRGDGKGAFYFGLAHAKYISCDGTSYFFGPGAVTVDSIQTSQSTGSYWGSVIAGGYGLSTPSGGADAYMFHYNSPNIYINVNSATGWQIIGSVSDERLKYDIAPSTFDCLDAVKQMPLAEYRWRPQQRLQDKEPDPQYPPIKEPVDRFRSDGDAPPLIPVGFIAQHLYKSFPYGVEKGDDGNTDPRNHFVWDIDANTMLAVLTGAVQQLAAQNDALKEEITAIRATRTRRGKKDA